MKDFIEILTQKLDRALDETVLEIDRQEKKIDSTISDLSSQKETLSQKKQQTIEEQHYHSHDQTQQTQYNQILNRLVDNLKKKEKPASPTRSTTQTVQPQSPFSAFPIIYGDIYLTYRLTADKSEQHEQIHRYNQFYTRRLADHLRTPNRPAIYILDVIHLLQIFFDEIRHIESCHKYQEADWKTNQVSVVLNESYRTLIRLMEEILSGYNALLQVSPTGGQHTSPKQVRIRTATNQEQAVDLADLSYQPDSLTSGKVQYRSFTTEQSMEVQFAGFLKEDLNIIFPLSVFDVFNPHVLNIMLGEFKQRQHGRALDFWRQAELRIQQLGDAYQTELHEQLIGWLE